MSTTRIAGALGVVLVALAGCRDDGRTLDPAPEVPVSRETTTTSGPAADGSGSGGDVGVVGGVTLTSPAFAEGALLDEAYSCNGTNVSPPLVVTGVPTEAVELAIVVTDRDAGGFVHWAVAGIPPSVTTLEPGLLPPEAVMAMTDSGTLGWDGPCPPPGDGAHTYDFTVHVMREPIGLAPGTDGRDAVDLIQRSSVASDTLVATYASPTSG